jgi:hypothetical protein
MAALTGPFLQDGRERFDAISKPAERITPLESSI